MSKTKLVFIGGGNMTRSLIGGLLHSNTTLDIAVSDPNPEQRQRLTDQFGIPCYADNLSACAQADIIVFAVKPQALATVAKEVGSCLAAQQPLIISIAAGVREPDLRRWLGFPAAIVRCMPNTPALIQSGVSGLYANEQVNSEQRNQAESLLRAVGSILWLEQEAMLDAVTALSGSGPAYFFAVMEAIEAAGISLGLSAEQARFLTIETAFGAAKMALESRESPAELRNNVTSKGGTTAAALEQLQQGGLSTLFQQALQAAALRAAELGQQLGAN